MEVNRIYFDKANSSFSEFERKWYVYLRALCEANSNKGKADLNELTRILREFVRNLSEHPRIWADCKQAYAIFCGFYANSNSLCQFQWIFSGCQRIMRGFV